MTIQEGEAIFGKRWNLWSREEQIEFVKALTGSEPRFPIYLNLACAHWQHLPDAFEKAWEVDIKSRMRTKKMGDEVR